MNEIISLIDQVSEAADSLLSQEEDKVQLLRARCKRIMKVQSVTIKNLENDLKAAREINKPLRERIVVLERRMSTCGYCGQRVASNLGGHTSSCYERQLNILKQKLEELVERLKR